LAAHRGDPRLDGGVLGGLAAEDPSVHLQHLLNSDLQLSDLSDDGLIRAIAAGEEAALAELYRRYQAPLFNYIVRLINDPAAAEETLQEVFLAAWRGAAGFRGAAKGKTWLFRIAHHRAVSWLRQLRPALPLEAVENLLEADAAEELVFEKIDADQLRTALGQLSPAHRAVIELVFVHELSYQEAALVMGSPLGTIKSRLSYALRRLAGLLIRLEGGQS